MNPYTPPTPRAESTPNDQTNSSWTTSLLISGVLLFLLPSILVVAAIELPSGWEIPYGVAAVVWIGVACAAGLQHLLLRRK
jgi:hypothetical protein